MNEVEYVPEFEVRPITVEYENIPTKPKPIKPPEDKIFRPVLPQPVKHQEKSFTIRKPLAKIDKPIEDITFASFEEYLNYKTLHHG